MAQPQRKESTGEEQKSFSHRPVDSARHGNVEIALWRNEGGNGEFYSASTPTIRYKEATNRRRVATSAVMIFWIWPKRCARRRPSFVTCRKTGRKRNPAKSQRSQWGADQERSPLLLCRSGDTVLGWQK